MTTDQEEALFDMQLIIDDVLLRQSEILQYLTEDGRFDLNASHNGLYLPISRELAEKLGCSRFCSDPHPAYREGMMGRLRAIEGSADGRAAMQGDLGATERVVEAINMLQATVMAAIINGDLMLD